MKAHAFRDETPLSTLCGDYGKRNDDPIHAAQPTAVPSSELRPTPALDATPRSNYWTEREAKGDIELPRCIHGEPRNVFCGKCEG